MGLIFNKRQRNLLKRFIAASHCSLVEIEEPGLGRTDFIRSHSIKTILCIHPVIRKLVNRLQHREDFIPVVEIGKGLPGRGDEPVSGSAPASGAASRRLIGIHPFCRRIRDAAALAISQNCLGICFAVSDLIHGPFAADINSSANPGNIFQCRNIRSVSAPFSRVYPRPTASRFSGSILIPTIVLPEIISALSVLSEYRYFKSGTLQTVLVPPQPSDSVLVPKQLQLLSLGSGVHCFVQVLELAFQS